MRIGIYGYGNLGRGVELALAQNSDLRGVAVFTRRDPSSVRTLTGLPVVSASEIGQYEDQIDVLVLCGGSATDLPEMTPNLAKRFNVVDSFDTHAKIPEHFETVDRSAHDSGHLALISGGWDPGLFSLSRLYASAVLPDGKDYTFWGRGVSQGHSDAIRRIDGVLDARQYTVPSESALEAVRSGQCPELSVRDKHFRECYVVAKEGADLSRIEREIKEMPNYFADYDTSVTFISAEEMAEKHGQLPHGGSVIRTGKTGLHGEHTHTFEFSLKLDSNPEFTGSVLCALARAVGKRAARGETGCLTVFDLAPKDLSPLTDEEIRAHLL
ncbi:MAG: diaminopimelate dehydrogenase [Clostridia bacterium]|nr:diaminopimelate dehydrogenase [Clostridia bacterium]